MCPFEGGCPLLGGSIKRGSTVHTSILLSLVYRTCIHKATGVPCWQVGTFLWSVVLVLPLLLWGAGSVGHISLHCVIVLLHKLYIILTKLLNFLIHFMSVA